LFCDKKQKQTSVFQDTKELLGKAQSQKNAAAQFLQLGDWRNAIRLLTHAREILTVVLGKDHELTIEVVDLLGEGYFQAGLPELAKMLWEDSRNRRKSNRGARSNFPTDNRGSIAC
jgi:lipopolysaccharide biosynthesis regulator YciM